MKMLPLNLLYLSDDGYLISSPHLRQAKNLLGIIVGDVAFGLEEYQMPSIIAQKFISENPLGGTPSVLASPEETVELLRSCEDFNHTADILNRYGYKCAPLQAEAYWTNHYDWCGCYTAVKKRGLLLQPCSGQTSLSFRKAIRLKPLQADAIEKACNE